MKGYLSIGAVSKQKNVSIKSLRYYDRIGVLKPAYVNQKTNYRYYTEEQLYLLDAIGLCIELGIPLKDFEKYTDGKHFHLRQLLYDGKILAEQKILDIRARLETVQAALHSLEKDGEPLSDIALPKTVQTASPAMSKEDSAPAASSATAPFAAAKTTVQSNLPEGFYRRQIPERALLIAPLEEDSLENYGQKVLRLFMLAQLLGMTAEYPSGLLYDYKENGRIEKFLFIHVQNYKDCADKRLRIIPKGSYLCIQHDKHRIARAPEILKEAFASQMPLTVIESDIIDENIKQGENSLEMQVLL